MIRGRTKVPTEIAAIYLARNLYRHFSFQSSLMGLPMVNGKKGFDLMRVS